MQILCNALPSSSSLRTRTAFGEMRIKIRRASGEMGEEMYALFKVN